MSIVLTRNKRAGRNAYSRKKADFTGLTSLPTSGFKRLSRMLGCLILVGMVLVGVSFVVLRAYNYATTWDYFNIENIDVRGIQRLSRASVLKMAGLELGKNSIALNLAEIERNMRQSPWVESVRVRRSLPDGFIIDVKERPPVFTVRQEGILYYVDVHGKLIAPLDTANFISLPLLEIEIGAENIAAQMDVLVDELKSSDLPVDFASVSWIRLSPGKGVEIFIESRDLRLCVAPEDWKENLTRIVRIMNDLAQRGEFRNVHEIRAADGNVWVVCKQNVANS